MSEKTTDQFLEIIHNIFDQVSGNISADYQQVVKKILNISVESSLHENNVTPSKKFSLLKVLLLFFEKYHESFQNTNHLLETVFQHVEIALDSVNKNLPEVSVQDVLIVIGTLCRISTLNESEDGFSKLLKFYKNNVDFIQLNYDSDSSNSGQLYLRLKVLSTVYEALAESQMKNNNKNVSVFFEKCCSGEGKLFTNVILHAPDGGAMQTLLYVIPNYIKCRKNNKVFCDIWQEISKFMNDDNFYHKLSRTLLVMCYIFDLCFCDIFIDTKTELLTVILEDENYWKLIQYGLMEKDPVSRKQGMYLFKKSIELLNEAGVSISTEKSTIVGTNSHKVVMLWDSSFKHEMYNIFNELIVILEFLDEQQIHIIKPIFNMIDKIVHKILTQSENGKIINFSWILLIYHRMLTHESAQVVKWGLQHLLKLPSNFFAEDGIVATVVNLLVPSLNNTSLYYNDGLSTAEDLITFFQKLTPLKTSKEFFRLFIKKICELTWSPEALFFVMHAIANIPKQAVWGKEEVHVIRNFVSKAFKTHNKIIRTGVQCELLHSVVKLTKGVLLEDITLLISSFSTLQRGSKIWNDITKWIRESYEKEAAEDCIQKAANLNEKFNERFLAFMMILFFDVYDNQDDEKPVATSSITRVLLSFKEIGKRLYCDKTLQDCYLWVIHYIFKEILNGFQPEKAPLLKITLPFLMDIISYIQMQVKQSISLNDFYVCELYSETFEYILIVVKLFKVDVEYTLNDLLTQFIQELENFLNQNAPPIQIFCVIKLIRTLLKISNLVPKSSFLQLYIMKEVNEALQKEDCHLDKTRDLQTLWGRITSEYLEVKWEILEYIISCKHIFKHSISDDVLIAACTKALNVGGYGVLCPLMKILQDILPKSHGEDMTAMIYSIWKLIMERRKTDEFKTLIKQFVQMLFQKETMTSQSTQQILFEYTDLIFADTSLAVVNIFMKHIQKIGVVEHASSLCCYILAKGLIFGPVQRKDEKLTVQVCSLIEFFKICDVTELNTSNEIRASAVQIILCLDKNYPAHQIFVENLIQTLLSIESEMNKNKTRYFGDSHVHRVKHRLMQALLLLEPFLNSKQDVAEKLSKWLYKSLMTENPQPSVKYQQEWLLIRLLIKNDVLLRKFWDYFSDSVDKKSKGLCSLIAISFHLCKLVSSDLAVSFISQAIITFLPFCMDQHFEVRLYSQVVLEKLYKLSQLRKLNDIVKNYEVICNCVSQSIKRGFQGNAGKNCTKLQEDFYLNAFHPLEHYSLQTIYMDLPRLANIGSDEWISTDVFKRCGLEIEAIHIPIKSQNTSLEEIDEVKWLVERSTAGLLSEVDEEVEESTSGNYQKKMIPLKPLFPGQDERVCNNIKKDGLIVVASLIDRIPNLGGLARTCEIFGASEYVVGSLKYIEDKQFTSLSVTAEKWVRVKEVKLKNLTDYILEMKQIGYTVVGAEQALYSQSLNNVKLPKKSLLLLGNEKEGIPANLLPLLDICIEIPQVGIIRSLNVHVTGALFIWEYAKQNYFS